MGILKPQPGLYYDNLNPDYGSYKKLSLLEAIDSFNATYVGEGKICEGVLINDITSVSYTHLTLPTNREV